MNPMVSGEYIVIGISMGISKMNAPWYPPLQQHEDGFALSYDTGFDTVLTPRTCASVMPTRLTSSLWRHVFVVDVCMEQLDMS